MKLFEKFLAGKFNIFVAKKQNLCKNNKSKKHIHIHIHTKIKRTDKACCLYTRDNNIMKKIKTTKEKQKQKHLFVKPNSWGNVVFSLVCSVKC